VSRERRLREIHRMRHPGIVLRLSISEDKFSFTYPREPAAETHRFGASQFPSADHTLSQTHTSSY